MNRDAFYAGVEIEFHKLASAGNYTQAGATTAKSAPAAQAATPAAPSPQRDALQQQVNIARQEGENVPGTARNFLHSLGNTFVPNSVYKNQISEQVNNAQPGQVIKPLSGTEMMERQTVLDTPELLSHAKGVAANKAQEMAKGMTVNQLRNFDSSSMGQNEPLTNALKQHVAYDPESLKGLSGVVGDKTYGAFGVAPGLKADFTPGNFQFGNFAKDHWDKLLAGGGLLAALMWAMKGGGRQQQQPIVINNGYPQPQQQRRELPGYAG